MKWSLWIGRYFGIDVYLHVTFLLLLAFIWTGDLLGRAVGLPGMLGLYLALFLCVLLHEFGHALMARRFGIPTRDITLLPIGGVARLEGLPEKPVQEFLVAIAGPAVNVVIALLLLPVVLLQGGFSGPIHFPPEAGGFVETVLLVNVWLVLFNLLPAFPMDGGRVLRSLLAMKLPYAKATNIAAKIGQAMAVVFGVVAFQTGHLLLGLIAVFVWQGASRENRYARIRDVFRDLTAGDALQPTPGWLEPNDTLSRAVRLHRTHPQAAYPVLLRDEPVGFVLPDDLARVFPVAGPAAPVTAAMRSGGIVVVPVNEPLENVVTRLEPDGVMLALVERDGALAGLVSPASIGDCIERATAERRGVPMAAPPPLPDGPRLT